MSRSTLILILAALDFFGVTVPSGWLYIKAANEDHPEEDGSLSISTYCAEPCCTRRPTQRVTTRVELQPDESKDFTDGYCTEHAAQLAEQIEHGVMYHVALVSIVALPPVVARARHS